MGKIETQRVSLIVTKACTLNCRLCGALAPYIGMRYNPSASFLKSELDAYFNLVAKTGLVDISGGEPLLRSGSNQVLADVLRYLENTYSGQFERLRVFTNGTTVPDDALCDAFRWVSGRKPFTVTVDDYGTHSPRIPEIAERLCKYAIDFSVREYTNVAHCGGWVDLRDMSARNDDAEARALFSKCAIPQKLGCCLELMDGIISPCSVAASRYLCGLADKDSPDIVDLFAEPASMQDKLLRILNAPVFSSCTFCNGGMTDESPRFTPAEQVTTAEIEAWNQRYKMTV